MCGFYELNLIGMMAIVEWYMAKHVVEDGRQKDMCSNEIGLCVQNKHITIG